MSSNNENNKRKRTKNTTKEQFELYLKFMESDYYFRSGTIDPTLEEKYIENKWKELCDTLNAIGDGPHLEVEVWKKTFNDWKYTTRAKYRKIKTYENKTGSGPLCDIKLTELEERGISVWGKVAVIGIKNVTEYEGINIAEEIMVAPILDSNIDINIFKDNDSNNNIEQPEITATVTDTSNNKENLMQNPSIVRKRVATPRPTPLADIAEKLVTNTKEQTQTQSELVQIVKDFSNNFLELENEKVKIEKERLRFELEKFKFQNPQFNFQFAFEQ